MDREQLELEFWANRWPTAAELVDHVWGTYYSEGAADCTEQDAHEQARKLALFYEEHGRLPRGLGEWMPGWEDARG